MSLHISAAELVCPVFSFGVTLETKGENISLQIVCFMMSEMSLMTCSYVVKPSVSMRCVSVRQPHELSCFSLNH